MSIAGFPSPAHSSVNSPFIQFLTIVVEPISVSHKNLSNLSTLAGLLLGLFQNIAPILVPWYLPLENSLVAGRASPLSFTAAI